MKGLMLVLLATAALGGLGPQDPLTAAGTRAVILLTTGSAEMPETP
jgi:hypothetical protein